MSEKKRLCISGFALCAAIAAYDLVSVLISGIIPSLGFSQPDGGVSLFAACSLTAFLFVVSGIFISFRAGDIESVPDFVHFLYTTALCIICKCRGYDTTGIFPGVLLVLTNISSCFASFFLLRTMAVFFRLSGTECRSFWFRYAFYVPFILLAAKYLLVFAGVIDFWNTSLEFTGKVVLWLFIFAFVMLLLFFLKRIPIQSSLSIRVIFLGYCLAFLPFLCLVARMTPVEGVSVFRMNWSPASVFSLLSMPLSFICAANQIVKVSSDSESAKIMTGCSTLVLILCIITIWPSLYERSNILLLLSPVVYQLLTIPLDRTLHPRVTAAERSLDSLERTAFRCSDESRIFEVVADWIVSMLNPEFVAFYGKPAIGESEYGVLFSTFKNGARDGDVLDQMIEERMSRPEDDTKILHHRKAGFSVPLFQMHEQTGFVFIGSRSEEDVFSRAETELMTPVTRILMESMMVLDLRQQADYVSEMQNQIVFSFADMVESRDGTTGQHIKRTSTIVSLLTKNLREHNLYADKLLPSDYDMIALAAPLHDIGKIKVPDSILSKPGKLTEDEFATIRTHPVEGEKIINKTMSHIENERYLKLAREMALYHHEKWDGKGYPEGLAGEDIPVSARIMAIADVFDALCSKRSYKEAFSVSQAFNILEESRGSHFEPCLVDAMKVIKPELEKLYTAV